MVTIFLSCPLKYQLGCHTNSEVGIALVLYSARY
jgi:hypothetical protein